MQQTLVSFATTVVIPAIPLRPWEGRNAGPEPDASCQLWHSAVPLSGPHAEVAWSEPANTGLIGISVYLQMLPMTPLHIGQFEA